ncbi:MAG: hypothetical protein JNM86_06835 [Phycisphaerae bacterium]|nr:hypothetical protein [Phycisphaerae bacterium]
MSEPGNPKTPASPAGAEPAPPRFRLDPIPLGIGAVAAIAVFAGTVRTLARADPDAYRISHALGAAIGLLLWPLIASWIAFRLAGRSIRFANGAFILVLLVCLVAHVTRSRGSPGAPAPSAQTPASIAEIRALAEQAKQASLGGDEQKAIALTAESASKFDQAASVATGIDKVVMEYAASLARAQNDVLKAYITAAGTYADAGGTSLDGLRDSAAIDARLALLHPAVTAHDDVIAYFRSISDRIPTELAARSVPKKAADDFLAGFVANARIDNLLAIHAAEHGMLLAARRRFEILKANNGNWTNTPENGLAFGESFTQKDRDEFLKLGDTIDRLAAQQGELIAERKSGN